MVEYQGPVRPGTSEEEFRRTGRSTTPAPYQGPTRPTDDSETFRRTGSSTGSSSNRSSSSSRKTTQVQQDAQVKAREEALKKQVEEKIRQEQIRNEQIKQQEIQRQNELQRIQQSQTQIDKSYYDPRFELSNTQPKSSGAVATSYKPSQYLNEQRAKTGGFFGAIAGFLGLNKNQKVELPPSQRGTIIEGRNPYVIDEKQIIQEKVLVEPNIVMPKKEYEKSLTRDISNQIEQQLQSKYEQKMIDEQNRIYNNLKAKVDRGEISVEVANRTLKNLNENLPNKFNKEYNEEFNQLYNQRINQPDIQNKLNQKEAFDKSVQRTYGKDAGAELKKLRGVALDVGVSLLGPEVATPYFVAKGASSISKGAKQDIVQAEVNQRGETFVPLYPTVQKSEETKKGESYFNVAGLSALTAPSYLIRKAGQEQIKELSQQPFRISGEELIKTNKGTLTKVSAERSIGSAKQEVEFLIPSFNINKSGLKVKDSGFGYEILEEIKPDSFTSFFITKGKSRIKAVNPIDQNKVIESESLFGGGGRARGAGAVRVGRQTKEGTISRELPDTQGSVGGGYLEFDNSGKLKPFRFIGGSKDKGETIGIISGEPTKSKIGNKVTISGKVKGYGEIKKIGDDTLGVIDVGIKAEESVTGTPSLVQVQPSESVIFQNVVSKVGKETVGLIESPKESTRIITSTAKTIRGKSEPSLVQEEKIKVETRPIGLLPTSQVLIQKESQVPKLVETPLITTSPRTKVAQPQLPSILQPVLQQPKPRQLSRPFVNVTPKVNPPFNFSGDFGIPKFDANEVGGGERRRPERLISGKAPKYSPSLGSVLLKEKPVKITESELGKLSRKRYTGLELRPLVEVSENKKKKKGTKTKSEGLGLF